ncbi:hypothetical protein PIB30_023270 [Stylosanthes scabra]|uniref:Polygalacturonase n=1 Tax=Stylosanthes scabra TaxID=79078 RepID=A0ABU6Z914_9FABA|nr:hypothetical protein [Stylosanthes scabra]
MGASFNVLDYGARGDGRTDDSAAFLKAWQDACGSSEGNPEIIIPDRNRRFMLQPVKFEGPCKSSSITIKLFATITAPNSIDAWKWPNGDYDYRSRWIRFSHINDLIIVGRGTFDGQGAPWWDCFKAGKCGQRPSALSFLSCPNTDGIDIAKTTNILILNSTIETGDDCFALNGGTSFVHISNVFCGPGHGISIGSLGKGGSYETVEEIYVKNCIIKGTTNGARIKTWQGGSGYAKKITFENIRLDNVENPIIIDQQYSDFDNANGGSAVKVSDITYRNIQGTSIDGGDKLGVWDGDWGDDNDKLGFKRVKWSYSERVGVG